MVRLHIIETMPDGEPMTAFHKETRGLSAAQSEALSWVSAHGGGRTYRVRVLQDTGPHAERVLAAFDIADAPRA